MALNGHPTVAKATRVRVQAVAEKLGYRRNPAFAALGSRARWQRAVEEGTPVALIEEKIPGYEGRGLQGFIFAGASQRGQRLGFRLEDLVVSPTTDWNALLKQLRARGFAGVIFSQLANLEILRHPGWSHFALVSAGLQTHRLPIHSVRFGRFEAARRTVLELFALGYRRIAWLYARHEKFHAEEDFSRFGGIMAGLQECGIEPARAIPPFVLPTGAVEECTRRKVGRWLRQWKPEVLISTTGGWRWQLQLLGYSVPEDLALATLLNDPEPVAGVRFDHQRLGEEAIELLDGALRHGQFGLPSDPKEVVLGGKWFPGITAPPLRAVATNISLQPSDLGE